MSSFCERRGGKRVRGIWHRVRGGSLLLRGVLDASLSFFLNGDGRDGGGVDFGAEKRVRTYFS